ncbi:methyltransferase domain-containing protein [Amycolatopsis sp. NPDC051758]|uniref:methyltransferase domain-containing protein n=1 Tax=Amycolatopsis sp. NPDC051758 TaxID=3363935 RepID=UPI00379D2490
MPAGFLPAVYDAVLGIAERAGLRRMRHRLLADAAGTILDIGAGTGTGLNAPHYPRGAQVLLLEPDSRLATRAAARTAAPVLRGDAHHLPLADSSVDTVVLTLVLCTVARPERVLWEIRRVLRPGGRLLLIEHVRSPAPRTARWQHRLTPYWRHLAGDCRLDRDTRATLRDAGFDDTGLGRCRIPAAPALLAEGISGTAIPAPRPPSPRDENACRPPAAARAGATPHPSDPKPPTEGHPTMTSPSEITPRDAAAMLEWEPATVLLDVREDDEYAAGHAPAARHLPLGRVDPHAVDSGATVIAVCRSGGRSARATETLREGGHTVLNLTGGMREWAAAGLPVVTDAGAGGEVI